MVSEELAQPEPQVFLRNWLGKWLGKWHTELSDSLPGIQSGLLTLPSRSHWRLRDMVKGPGQEEQWLQNGDELSQGSSPMGHNHVYMIGRLHVRGKPFIPTSSCLTVVINFNVSNLGWLFNNVDSWKLPSENHTNGSFLGLFRNHVFQRWDFYFKRQE